jgi:SAM-dependent methyltransferase
MMKWVYEIAYRYFRMPYDAGPVKELVGLVGNGRIPPCRAIDLGCGTGRNAIFLAQHGCEVTGVDIASSGIAEARRRAQTAGVQVEFVVDDLTDLQQVKGTFDLLVDVGTLDVFPRRQRHLYLRNVLPLTHPGSLFLLSGWEWSPRWWERPFPVALAPGEIDLRFGEDFEIECIVHETNPQAWGPTYFLGQQKPPGSAVYLMTRKSAGSKEQEV